MLGLLQTLAAVWFTLLALAGVGILTWIGWRMLFPPARPAIATAWTLTASAGQTDRRVYYTGRRTSSADLRIHESRRIVTTDR